MVVVSLISGKNLPFDIGTPSLSLKAANSDNPSLEAERCLR
jgi:hypothetical protein